MQASRRIQEEILLFKISHGDEESFAKVYDSYVDALFRFIRFRVPNVELAQDITSELFLKLWQATNGRDSGINNLQAFIYKMARNLIADYYRTAQATLPLEQADEVSAPNISGGESTWSEVELAIRKLKPEWREIVVMAYIEGFKPREIARIIDKSSAATRVMLHRALQELKRIMGEPPT